MGFGDVFGLILCNLLWSAHPLMGKYVLERFTPAQGAWLRYLSALLAYLFCSAILLAWRRLRAPAAEAAPMFARPRSARDAGLLFALGFSAFCFSPLLQMSGLSESRAMDNSVIVAMEPLMTVLMAWILVGEEPAPSHFLAFGVALAGFALLAGLAMPFEGASLTGNLLMLASLLGEALYSSLGRKLLSRHRPASIFGSAILAGAAVLTLAAAISPGGLPSGGAISGMGLRSALAVAWLGPLGTALSYLYWMHLLQNLPIATIALSLFIQPLLGSVWGAVILRERLAASQGLGAVLILVAVFGQTLWELRKKRI